MGLVARALQLVSHARQCFSVTSEMLCCSWNLFLLKLKISWEKEWVFCVVNTAVIVIKPSDSSSTNECNLAISGNPGGLQLLISFVKLHSF